VGTTVEQVKHVNLAAGCVEQDAREVKTKFSKSFATYFFPVGDGRVQSVEPEPGARESADDLSQLRAGGEPAAGGDYSQTRDYAGRRTGESGRTGEGTRTGDAGLKRGGNRGVTRRWSTTAARLSSLQPSDRDLLPTFGYRRAMWPTGPSVNYHWDSIHGQRPESRGSPARRIAHASHRKWDSSQPKGQ